MNKLEEYKKSLLIPTVLQTDSIDESFNRGFVEGFDAAIALDLPIKFVEWKENPLSQSIINNLVYLEASKEPNTSTLYQYWLDNILKLES